MKRMMLAFWVLAAVFASGAAFGDEAFERALSLAAEKRYPEAREALDPLLARTPDNPRVRVLHGTLLAREGRTGEAIGVFEALRRDHPDMTEPYNNLAVLHAMEGRLEDARTILLATLERRPDVVAWANLGDVYERLARRAYQQARALEAGAGGSTVRDASTATARSETPGGTTQSGSRAGEAKPRQPGTEPGEATSAAQGVATQRRNAATGSQGAAAGFPAPDPPPAVAIAVPAPDTRIEISWDTAAETRAAAPESASEPDAFCAHAGEFLERRTVAGAAKWLQSFGVEVLEVRRAEHRNPISYKVYLPPLASRRQAVAKLGEIQGRGVRDVGLISDGDLTHGISFGVYQDADNMNRRVAEMERLGYSVRSQAAEVKVVREYTLGIRATGTPAALDATWKSRYPKQPFRVVDCD